MAAVTAVAMLAACSAPAPVKLPEVPMALTFREAGPWQAAQSASSLPQESWWTLFGDDELNALQQRLLQSAPDLAAAFARYQQAQALAVQLGASQWPSLNASASVQRNRQSERRPLRVLGPNSPDLYSSNTLGVDLQYEVDLWGRVRDQVAAGDAQQRAAEADLAAVRLALQAQLTDNWTLLRGLDRDIALLREAEAAYTKARELVQSRRAGGVASGLDLARAEAQLESTRSQLRQAQAQRAVLEHAIAALIGETPSAFTVAPRLVELALPPVPAGVPSALLQRRPDIVAAQQRVVAANASVGVARAAVFPVLTLGAQAGFQSNDITQLIGAPNIFWAVGPTLLASLFDGGRRQAETDRARAVLDEAGARYRGVVLGAFQQVEDSLALLDHYGAAAQAERNALAAAQRALELATTRWREGAASYLEVITAQTAALQSQRSAADLATRQRRANLQLIRALGGGWMGLAAS